jgi:hypothetical protein
MSALSTDVYRLAVPTSQRFLLVGWMVAFTLFGLGVFIATARSTGTGLHWVFPLFLCAAMAWSWHLFLTMPYQIRFESSDRIQFTALARTTTLRAANLLSIKPSRRGGFYVVRHEDGRIRLFVQFTGFHEVISRIKVANPNFEVVGI